MEQKEERFSLNSLCEFSNRKVESDFMEYEKSASLNIVRLLLLGFGVVFVLFVFSDYYYHGGGRPFLISLGLRGVGLLVTVAAFFLVGKFNNYEHVLITITLTELAVFGIYLVNLYCMGNRESALQYMSVTLFILTAFLIPNRWKNCLISAFITVTCYVVFCAIFLEPEGAPALVQQAIFLYICLVYCALFIHGREKSRRRQFSAEKYLEFAAITDKLTGIYNRGRFEYTLGFWIKSLRHFPFCLVFFDIDNFKKVNDRYGHLAGDDVLVDITGIISSHIRGDDIFARWGGEEFVVLLGNISIERTTELAERLRTAVEEHTNEKAGKITISIGVVQYRNGETASDLIQRADEKMYEAKQAGKNRVMAEIIQT